MFFKDKVSLCSFDWPGAYNVDKVGLELTEMCLPMSPWIKGIYWYN